MDDQIGFWDGEVTRGFAICRVPGHLWDGLRRHCIDGGGVGLFLTAVLDNNLREAVARADDQSLAGLRAIVQFLHNYAPPGCWGDEERREGWQRRGGVRGRGKHAA